MTDPVTLAWTSELVPQIAKRDLARQGNITQLRQLDSTLWGVGSARVVQSPMQPMATSNAVQAPKGALHYRSVYYYSTDPTRPYMYLKTSQRYPLPLPCICQEGQYRKFLARVVAGDFAALGISLDMM